MSTTAELELTIKPHSGWQPLDLLEIWHYRELFTFLVWRDIKVRYKQTFFGTLWAVLQPLASMLIFTIFFHRLAGIQTGGPPYTLFAYAGLVVWTFFSNSVSISSNCLVGNTSLISKIYFPRVFLPLASIVALMIDALLSLLLIGILMIWYRWPTSLSVLWVPVFLGITVLASSGLGLMLSAWNVSFRDIKYVVPFCLQLGMFVTPVIYPLSYIPARFHRLIGLNPMVGMVVGFRHALLGSPAPWDIIGVSSAISVMLFTGGLFIFRRMERRFADII